MHLNGWLRLWIVFAGALVIASGTFAAFVHSDASRPEESAHYVALLRQHATKYEIKRPDGEQFEIALPADMTKAQIEEFFTASDAIKQEDFNQRAELTLKRAAARQAAQARISNQKARDANRTVYTILSVIVLGLALGAYLIGAAIAWIRAGFR